MNRRTFMIAKKNIPFAFLASAVFYLRFLLNPELDGNINYTIKKNIPDSKNLGRFRMRRLQYELIKNKYFYGFMNQEYFSFDLENKSRREKQEYVGGWERMYYLDSVSSAETQEKFNNKYLCSRIFDKYYKRDVTELKSKDDFGNFLLFIAEHKRFMVKPEAFSLGVGIRIVDVDEFDDAVKLFADIIKNGCVVLEELVMQSESMAVYHSESVNTIRFVTAYNNGRTEYVYALLRMGVSDSVVDNVYSGGIVAQVDTETGGVVTPGLRREGGAFLTFDRHPDTDAQITGSTIPRWGELLDTINELVGVVPEQKYVGWDMALTDDGWVMIEGNAKPSFGSIQVCTGKGFRSKFEHIKDFLAETNN